jgi:fructokinase
MSDHAQQTAGSLLMIGEALVDCFPDQRVIGGAPFNVARNLGAFGVLPAMITRVGDDLLGEMIVADCKRFAVSTHGVQIDPVLSTGHVDVIVSNGGHKFAIGDNAAWDAIDSTLALQAATITKPSIVCFGTLAQRSPVSQQAIIGVLEQAQKNGAQRVLDLNLRSSASTPAIAEIALRHADIVKVNDDELRKLVDWFTPFKSDDGKQMQAIVALIERFNLRYLLLTSGEKGYAAYSYAHGVIAQGNAMPQMQLVDTVGAGDAFTSVVILGEYLQWPITQTLQRASEFSSAVCGIRGAVAENSKFYEPWIYRWQLENNRTQQTAHYEK